MTDRAARLATTILWLTGLAGTCQALTYRLVATRWAHGASRVAWVTSALALGAGLVVALTPVRGRVLGESPGSPLKLLATTAQLGLLVLLLRAYDVEHEAFRGVLLSVVFFGFLVHHGLTDRLRLPFFVCVSIATITGVLGLKGGVCLVGIGLALAATCHLPVPFGVRVSLLVAAGLGLALLRSGTVRSPVPAATWPLVGAFFMFRTACYLYDVRHAKAPVGVWPTLAYFFLLPNVAFLIFPVVDFSTMRRSRFADDPYEIYQRGLRLLLRGVVCVLLYRTVYRYLVIPPGEVTGAGDLARYLASNLLLLLQVLGQLDLAVGILMVFGFDLPEINDLSLYSPGFAHFWRRTNTYWRDFVTKLVYYPTYFRLRRLGAVSRVLASMAIAFLVSALLHSYQWFWLRGEVSLSATDAAFWLTFGALLLVNVTLETRQSRRANVGDRTPAELLRRVLEVVATFVVVSVLWALWSASSVRDWLSLLRYAGVPSGQGLGWMVVAGAVLLVYGLAGAFLRPARPGTPQARSPFLSRWAVATALTLVLYAVALPPVTTRLGAGAGNVVLNLRSLRLNRFDDQELVRGYYENLTRVSVVSPALWRTFGKKGATRTREWAVEMGRPTGDLRGSEHLPGVRIDRAAGSLTTNRWGMRDRDYEREKAPGTYRAALVGGSYLVGREVPDGATFEALVEDRLNSSAGAGAGPRYELLNLGVSSYGPLESLLMIEQRALEFRPDAVFYLAVEGELRRPAERVMKGVRAGLDLVYPELRAIAASSGLDPSLSEDEARRRLRSRREEVLSFCYGRMVTVCRKHGAVPVWVYVPPVDMDPSEEEVAASRRLATEAGFVVLDLSDVYGSTPHARIRVNPENHHPNRLGHELIAEGLYRMLVSRRRELGLPLAGPAGER